MWEFWLGLIFITIGVLGFFYRPAYEYNPFANTALIFIPGLIAGLGFLSVLGGILEEQPTEEPIPYTKLQKGIEYKVLTPLSPYGLNGDRTVKLKRVGKEKGKRYKFPKDGEYPFVGKFKIKKGKGAYFYITPADPNTSSNSGQ